MQLHTAIALIQPAISNRSISTWADLGCGSGLFTSALATGLKEGSIIYAVDTNVADLKGIQVNNSIQLQTFAANFEKDELSLSALDGILMANSLHYVADKKSFIAKARKWMKSSAAFLLIEYDTETPNAWIPYPLSFRLATELFHQSGFSAIQKIGEQPSLYNRAGMYAAFIQP